MPSLRYLPWWSIRDAKLWHGQRPLTLLIEQRERERVHLLTWTSPHRVAPVELLLEFPAIDGQVCRESIGSPLLSRHAIDGIPAQRCTGLAGRDYNTL